MHTVTRHRSSALAVQPRRAREESLAHVPCFGLELLERRLHYSIDGAYQLTDMLVQPDGSSVVVGAANGTREIGLYRFNPDGTLDTGFGEDGAAMAEIDYDDAMVVARLDDGSYIVAGYTENETRDRMMLALWRFHADGTADRSWGDDGKVTQHFGLYQTIPQGIDITDDGKILVGGLGMGLSQVVLDQRMVMARFNADGSLDTTYGNDGVVITQLSTNDWVHEVRYDEDGAALVLMNRSQPNEREPIDYIARYSPDGTLDTSFGLNGLAEIFMGYHDPNVVHAYARDLARLPDGGYVVSGTVYTPGDPSAASRLVVSRYHADGSLDTSFGDDGLTLIGGQDDQVVGTYLEVAADGTIVVAASKRTGVSLGDHSNVLVDVAVARLLPNGSLDASFGDDGILVTDLGHSDAVWNVAIAPNGTVLVAGVNDERQVFVTPYEGVVSAPEPASPPQAEPETQDGDEDPRPFAAGNFNLFARNDDRRQSTFSLFSAQASDLLSEDASADELLPA